MTNLMKSISWPQVALAGVLVAGGVLTAIFAPEDVRGALVGLLVAAASWLRVRQ